MGHHTSEVILKFTDQFSSGFEKSMKQVQNGTLFSKKAIRELNSAGNQMIKTGSMMFVPLAAGIKACINAEIEYESAVAKVKTIADESQKSMNVISKEMVDISKTYGQNITDVSNGFYQVISATVDTEHAIDYMQVASRMAIGGFADMTTAVTGLTASMAAYSKYGYDMYRVGDILAQTQVKGKTTINELSEQLGEVLPYASNVGMSFEDLGAAMAVLTGNGLSTSRATVTLKNAINSILNPSAQAKKAFERLGVAYGSNAFDGKEFGDYLNRLKDAIGLSETARKKLNELMRNKDVTDDELLDFYTKSGVNIDNLLTMFKNIRGATAMISLTGSIEKYQRFRTSMNEENSKGLLEKQANIMLSTPKMQMNILRENFNESLRMFGEKLMPKFNEYLQIATDVLNKLNGMSDEQISQIVDNVVKIAAASAGLIVLGTIAKALASIMGFLNLIWKPIAGLAKGGGIVKGIGATFGKIAGGAATIGKAAVGKVLPAVLGFKLGMDLSETKIGDDSFSKYGDGFMYYDDPLLMESQLRDDVRERLGKVDYQVYDPITNQFTTVYKDDKKDEEKTNKTNTNDANTDKKLAYEQYDPRTNKWTNVYIQNVDVSGVEDLDGMITELNNAAESMR